MRGHGSAPLHIFILDADPAILEYIRSILEDRFCLTGFTCPADLKRALSASPAPDLLLVDWDIREEPWEENALGLLGRTRASFPSLPVILLACSAELKQVVAAVRLGAADVLLKPFTRQELSVCVDQCLQQWRPSVEDEEFAEIPLDENTSFVRSSRRMREIESQCMLVARADIPVLILGESGTGKEVAAMLIHKMSARSQRCFLKVNCAAMPADLLESELFGYEQGAFTGAVKSKPGKFEICNNGTIFLDEIGEMPPPLQAKLLQVLQDGSFARLGSRTTVKVDVRVIAATNIDIKAAIAQKSFREDLYYRLNGFTVRMPRLRDRAEEIPVLARHFMRKVAARYACNPLPISPALMGALTQYPWPGNLRELENTIKRYMVLGDERAILEELRPVQHAQILPLYVEEPVPNGDLKGMVRNLKGNAEALAITQSLESTGWNRKASATDLQISYKALLYKIKQYNITPQRKAPQPVYTQFSGYRQRQSA